MKRSDIGGVVVDAHLQARASEIRSKVVGAAERRQRLDAIDAENTAELRKRVFLFVRTRVDLMARAGFARAAAPGKSSWASVRKPRIGGTRRAFDRDARRGGLSVAGGGVGLLVRLGLWLTFVISGRTGAWRAHGLARAGCRFCGGQVVSTTAP